MDRYGIMKRLCSVRYCWKQYLGTCQMYCFPEPGNNMVLFELWVGACQNPAFQKLELTPQEIYQSHAVCQHHFDETDFNGSILKKTAVPIHDLPSSETDEEVDEPKHEEPTPSMSLQNSSPESAEGVEPLHPYDDPSSPLFDHSYAKRC